MRRQVLAPVPLLAAPAARLFLTSATLLFVELLLIRWIPANVIYVGFFRNFLLMASFLGIGVGILWGRDPARIPVSPFALVLFAVVVLVTTVKINVELQGPDEIFVGVPAHPADPNFILLPLIVVLTTVVMAGLAVPLGELFTSMPPLRAYGLDVLGSMAGVASFFGLANVSSPPPIWFLVVAAMVTLGALGSGVTRGSLISAAAMTGVLVLTVLGQHGGDVWSPYYLLHEYTAGGVQLVDADGVPHQAMWPVELARTTIYNQVYEWFPDRHDRSVLIIGAGTGTDTALALANGAGHVDAVEIDPDIQAIGLRDHPDRPYSDPRVTRYVDDGRAFLRSSTSTYDRIVFALPDSLTLVSTSANLRLESFLYTLEAFDAARDHLAPDGIFVISNYFRERWLVEKIAVMLRDSFGSPPIVRIYTAADSAATLAAGPAVSALGGTPLPGGATDGLDLSNAPAPATDDWPFLYLRVPTIAPYYLAALAIVVLFAVLIVGRAAVRSGTTVRRFSPHFFVLGIAFLLLETRSIVTFSLLFGATWIVNTLVFFAILASVLAAIAVNARFRLQDARPLYLALFASIGLSFVVSSASLLIAESWLRYLLASTITFAPVFFANLVFSHSFRDTRTADMAFASNLLGAMVGGAVEYLALITGYQMLLLVVALLYALAFVLARWMPLLADRELALGGVSAR